MNIVAHTLRATPGVPNHPNWPLLVYAQAVTIGGADPAVAFERLFIRNRWPAAWRNGVFAFHHFHPNAHEVLGVYSGEVTVLCGGEGGVTLTAVPGDVIVLPAGTGHKKLSSCGALGVVGAYPLGAHPDTTLAGRRKAERALPAISRVPLPDCDPVCGPQGPLFEHWKAG